MKRKDFLARLFGGFLGVSLIDQLANEGAALLEAEARADDEWTFTLLDERGVEVTRPVRCRVELRDGGFANAEPVEFPTFDRDAVIHGVRVRGRFGGDEFRRDVPLRVCVAARPGYTVCVEGIEQDTYWT